MRRKLAKAIVLDGITTFSKHCRERMKDHGMDALDCENTARGGWCEMVDFRDGTYRYQICTHRFVVVVAFDEPDEMTFVTCWKR